MVLATSLELFKDLTQQDYNHRRFDFHNEFNCEMLKYEEGNLSMLLRSVADDASVQLKFIEVEISSALFFNIKDAAGLTIDTLYRGRAQVDGGLVEISKEGKGYFYLEFYEGQKFEFWAKYMDVE